MSNDSEKFFVLNLQMNESKKKEEKIIIDMQQKNKGKFKFLLMFY